MLEAHIVKARKEFTVDVRLRLRQGERLALFGASGAGKSTILSCLAGFETPDVGEIRLGDLSLFPPSLALHQRPLAYLTQQDFLFPHLSVAENICFGISDYHRNGSRSWVLELRDRLRLGSLWHESSRRISGGQARRVALARMLARRPPLVLLDEPFIALDRPTTNELIDALLEWQGTLNFILIAVDHRVDVLSRLCSQAAVIEKGQVVQHDSWDQLKARPATALTARLLGATEVRSEQSHPPFFD
ncbi:MAG TPA: ATP-binding cassette domain-containing protein [Candidatus Binataceae bacterium]|nr:ATP-binding cassette domain-containing protein [Candidatus Binataceae bacterium]